MALAGAAPASAATARIGEPELELGGSPAIFTAEPGEANRLTASSIPGEPDAVAFEDGGAPIAAGEGCGVGPGDTVVCRADDLAGVRMLLGDRRDHLDASTLRDQNPPPDPSASNFFAVEVRAGDASDIMLGADATYSCLGGGRGDDEITAGVTPAAPERALCGPVGGGGDDRLVGSETDDPLSGGPGIDSVSGRAGDDYAGGGSGDDRIALGAGADAARDGAGDNRVGGGAGDDSLIDTEGADTLSGQEGSDLLSLNYRTATGADTLLGGPGGDTARLLCPSCEASLDGVANDGPSGAADDNLIAVEHATTASRRYDPVAEHPVSIGPGNDRLTGSALANRLRGGPGPDQIRGRKGEDTLAGEGGDDTLRAVDGEPNTLQCGAGEDRAVADRTDSLAGCEIVRRPSR